MKFFTRKHIEKTQNQKVDPRSQKFVDTIKVLLEDQGMDNPRAVNECSHKLLKVALNFFKHLSPGDDYTIEEVAEPEKKFRTTMEQYGIPDEDKQDDVFIKFFGTLNELGAGGLKE
jgi:hypothetical protein